MRPGEKSTVRGDFPTVIEHQLMLVPTPWPDGDEAPLAARPCLVEDLRTLGFRHRDELYDRMIELLEAAGVNHEEGAGSVLRYLIEYVIVYDHAMDSGDQARVRKIVTVVDETGVLNEEEEEG